MKVRVGNDIFNSIYLTNPDDIQQGMMNKTELNGCMVFKMNKGYHSFWMKNCLIPLDIIFVNNNIISKIHLNCPPADPHSLNPPRYSGLGNYVIEFPSGTANNWKVGDRVSFF